MTTWILLDYGVGNLHSLRKALEAAGARVEVTEDARRLGDAGVAVLPGVGAFGAVMSRLEPARDALRERHAAGKPTLGVCIGQQVLHDGSAEAPGVGGLGIVPGTVQRLPASAGKVPHIGWNQVEGKPGEALLADVPPGSHVYYVHSYAAPPGPDTVATTGYGTVFTAALRCRNTVGVQFHPEKSSTVGATILRNAVALLEVAA